MNDTDLKAAISQSPFSVLDDVYHYARLPPSTMIRSSVFLIASDEHETTVVFSSANSIVVDEHSMVGPFKLIRFNVSKPFECPGFIAHITKVISEEGISVLVISTFSFDYVLVRLHDIDKTLEALNRNGFHSMPSEKSR